MTASFGVKGNKATLAMRLGNFTFSCHRKSLEKILSVGSELSLRFGLRSIAGAIKEAFQCLVQAVVMAFDAHLVVVKAVEV